MLIRKNFTIVFLVLIFASCNSEETPQNRELIFGWFADSSCSGDCAQIYKIDNEKVFKDIDFNYPKGNYFTGNFKEMSTVSYDELLVLFDQLPDELIDEPNGYLDCTDCSDGQGGFYLEYKTDKIHKSWKFRNAQYPTYLENFRSLLLDKIELLNSKQLNIL